MRLKICLCLVLLWPLNVLAIELFGLRLDNTTSRANLREAVRNNGAAVIREAGDDNWFDMYDFSAVFKQSQQLFIGYDKQTATFSFAEYQLPYAYLKTMLARLEAKYGKAEVRYGVFESDTVYFWLVDGIELLLSQDWQAGVSRLQYSLPAKRLALQQAYQQSLKEAFNKQLEIDVNYF